MQNTHIQFGWERQRPFSVRKDFCPLEEAILLQQGEQKLLLLREREKDLP
jgi:hypothetical protein